MLAYGDNDNISLKPQEKEKQMHANIREGIAYRQM